MGVLTVLLISIRASWWWWIAVVALFAILLWANHVLIRSDKEANGFDADSDET